MLTDKKTLDWIQLIRTNRVGPRLFWDLLERYQTAERALQEIPILSQRKTGEAIALFPREKAEAELEAHRQKAFTVLLADDARFSSWLQKIPDCPPVLSVAGSLDLFHQPTLGIVGGRNASLLGKKMARSLAEGLSQEGWTIASGLARGIDGAAHEGALPRTIAVLAGGVDQVYPPEHRALYHRIIDEGGAVVSDMPLSLFPGASHFPRRNRIISGLSQGVIVIEAAMKSGSLITAKMALDQNREVFAVPGSPFDERSRGCNDLIRQGAVLTESITDILSNLSLISRPSQRRPLSEAPSQKVQQTTLSFSEPRDISEKDRSHLHHHVLKDLTIAPLSLEELLPHYSVPAEVLSGVLLELELSGKIMRHAHHRYSRIE